MSARLSHGRLRAPSLALRKKFALNEPLPACRMRLTMETTCLTQQKWRRMDGAVPPDPAAPEMFADKPTESPRSLGWLRDHGLTIGGSLLFVGGLFWLL
jgi:hypothetical protein